MEGTYQFSQVSSSFLSFSPFLLLLLSLFSFLSFFLFSNVTNPFHLPLSSHKTELLRSTYTPKLLFIQNIYLYYIINLYLNTNPYVHFLNLTFLQLHPPNQIKISYKFLFSVKINCKTCVRNFVKIGNRKFFAVRSVF